MLILHLHLPVAWCVINAVFEDRPPSKAESYKSRSRLGCDFLAEYETCLCTVNRSERFCSSAPNTALGFTATPGAMIASHCHACHDDYHPFHVESASASWHINGISWTQPPFAGLRLVELWF